MTPPAVPFASLALSLVAGCDRFSEETGRPGCRARCLGTEADQIMILLDAEGLDQPVEVQLDPCVGRARLPDGAAVVVALLGGFDATVTPVDRDELVALNQRGIVTLYPSFPQAENDFSDSSLGDYRGAGARLAAAAVLRYAADEEEDRAGCRLSERLDVPLSRQAPLLHGQSNGGNLALAILADEALDLPPITAVTTFETPAGAQFVTVELGSVDLPLAVYEPGRCVWSEEDGLACAVDDSVLLWDALARDERGNQGAACYDTNGDGACDGTEEGWIWGLRPTMDGSERVIYSPRLTQNLMDQGLGTADILTGADLESFWATRDGSLLVRQAVAGQPDLPFLILGTEVDHTQGTPDHPHVTGLAAALQAVGAAWVRVNPDAAYLARAFNADQGWDDNPANTPLVPGDANIHLLPDENGDSQRRRACTTAAFLELQDRRWLDQWGEDLAAPLLP